jgi:O-antigen ligase/polysaccharide polymerase Wzy-like membrane protein/tetratricopeptide repeat protein
MSVAVTGREALLAVPIGRLAARTTPTGLVLAGAAILAWRERGSTATAHWLGYAALTLLVLAVVLVAGPAYRPRRAALVALGSLSALGAWWALSAAWSPLPSLARDEGLLAVYYAAAAAVPLLSLRLPEERIAAVGLVAAVIGLLAIGTGVELLASNEPQRLFDDGRLYFPVSYANGTASLFLLGFWPAIGLAARHRSPLVVRSLALGSGVAVCGCWLCTQSKGAGLGLALSAVAFFALSPARLRALVPAALAAGIAAAGFRPLTEPFRASEADFADAASGAGRALLVLAGVGVVVGAAYAALDARLELSPRMRRGLGRLALAGLVAGVVGGAVTFGVLAGNPREFAADRWSSFKQLPERETGSTHFTTLGSSRYDFWRVSLNGFVDHPIAGIGGRGFGALYYQEKRTIEVSARAHSVFMDTLLEGGLVGTALLGLGTLPLLWLCARRARAMPAAVGGAAGLLFLTHSSVDWTWTIPAVGVPAFVLLGIGASGEDAVRLPARTAALWALVTGALALFVYAPTWLSARLTQEAYFRPDPAYQLDWAKRLDPLAVTPYIAEGQLAGSARAAIPPLRKAASKEPRNLTTQYALGVAYLNAGDVPHARLALERARALAPSDPLVLAAVSRVRAAAR